MQRLSSNYFEFLRFFAPLGISLYAVLFVNDLRHGEQTITEVLISAFLITIGSTIYFTQILRAKELWIESENLIIKKWKNEERIPLKEVEEIKRKKVFQGPALTIRSKNHEDFFFYPHRVWFPSQEKSIESKLKEWTMSNQSVDTIPVSAPR